MRKPVKLPGHIVDRDYQSSFVETAIDLIRSNPETPHLFSSPTGTGKSVMELRLLEHLPDGLFITPRVEIIQGMLEKLGDFDEDDSTEDTVSRAWQYGILTPIRLRNLLAKGMMPYRPTFLIVDECHHSIADTYKDIKMYLNGVPEIGLTATPYRGTPKGTKELYEHYRDTVNEILSLPSAVEHGYCSMPSATLLPLLDDDVINVTNGEFKVASVDAIVFDKIKYLVEYSRRYYHSTSRMWDRSTMFSVSSSAVAKKLTSELNAAGLQAECVTQETPTHERRAIFRRVIQQTSALVQIDVISEGVDLPIRRLIDIRPTMSPVKWVQQIGRIMRPTLKCHYCTSPLYRNGQLHHCDCEPPPEYICCCRNLERHAYLMEGLFPNSTIKETQEIFGLPSKRSGSRAIGLEGMGKFVNTPVQLVNGTTIFTYNLVHMEGMTRKEYFAIVHPNNPQIVVGEKVSTKDPNTNEMKWGKWKMLDTMPDVTGCVSAKASELTPNQMSFWQSAAESKGLNQHVVPNARQFQILPFLRNTGLSFR